MAALALTLIACQPKPYASFMPSHKEHFKAEVAQPKPEPAVADQALIAKKASFSEPPQLINLVEPSSDFLQQTENQEVSTSLTPTTPKTQLSYKAKATSIPTLAKPYSTPAPAVEEPRKTSVISVVSFLTALLGYAFTFASSSITFGAALTLGLILTAFVTGIIGLTKTGKKKRKGKAFAIIGLVMSSVYLILLGLLIAAFSNWH